MIKLIRLANVSLLAGLTIAVAAGSARAGVETYTANVASTPTNWGDGTQQSVSIPYFNTWGGERTLTGVVVTLQDTITGSASISGTATVSGAAGQYSVSLVDPDSLATPADGLVNLGLLPNQLDTGANLLFTNAVNAIPLTDGSYSGTYNFSNISVTASTTYTVPGNPVLFTTLDTLPAWEGTGNQLLYFVSGASVAGTFTSGSLILNSSTSADANLTVTYDYTDAPEPASLALLGAGLAGMGVVRRRRKA